MAKNTSQLHAIDEECSTKFLHASMNQNRKHRYLTVSRAGSTTLYGLAQLGTLQPLQHVTEPDCANFSIIRQVERTYRIEGIQANDPYNLYSANIFDKHRIGIIKCPFEIVNVLTDMQVIIAVMDDMIQIYDSCNASLLHTVRTADNPYGICAIAQNADLLAFPAHFCPLTVQLFNIKQQMVVTHIKAHDNAPLQCVALNINGDKLATASQNGTVIRVFVKKLNCLNYEKTYELRRGYSRNVTISTITFCLYDRFLVTSSNTTTVHVFKLNSDFAVSSTTPPEDASYLSSACSLLASAVSVVTPVSVSRAVCEEVRSFTSVVLPKEDKVVVASVETFDKLPLLMIVTDCGMVYIYDFSVLEPLPSRIMNQIDLEKPVKIPKYMSSKSCGVDPSVAAFEADDSDEDSVVYCVANAEHSYDEEEEDEDGFSRFSGDHIPRSSSFANVTE